VAGGFFPSIGVLSSAELYDPAANTWSLTGSMTDTRHGFTATPLSSGKVLVAGGGDSSVVVRSAELYDPTTGTWTATGSMAGPRWLHAATVLASGKVLVAGGQTGTTCGGGLEALSSAELYDPATGTWTSTGSLAAARHDFTVTLLPSGKVLAASGAFDCGGITVGSAELYDPGTGTWASAGSLATAHEDHTATLLHSGIVLVAGGLNGAGTALASVELYDPAAGTWSSGPSMTTMRSNHSATLLASGVVLVAGGTNGVEQASAERYTPPPPPQPPPPPPGPTLTSVLPISGPATGGTSVTVGGAAATSVVVVSSTKLTAVTPAHTAGAVTVTVTNANGSDSCAACFSYYVVRPDVIGTTPTFTKEDGYHARWSGESRYVDLIAGQLADLSVRFVNSGSLGWYLGSPGQQAVLGSSDPRDNTRDADAGILVAPLYDQNRFATASEAYVGPGAIGTFSFRVRAPVAPGTYQIHVQLLIEGVAWLEDQGVYLQITVR